MPLTAKGPRGEPALLALLRQWDAEHPTLDGVDWKGWLDDSARHGLTSWAAWRLAGRRDLPIDDGARLRARALALAAQTLRNRAWLQRLLGALAGVGVTPVLLKGVSLGARVYADPLHRATSDIDLWIAPDEREAAHSALRSAGWQPMAATAAHYPPRFDHHATWIGAGPSLELHKWLVTSFGRRWGESAAILDATVPSTFDGWPVRALSPEFELAFLGLHASNHLLERLSWLLDLALFCRRHADLDPTRLSAALGNDAARAACWIALDAGARLLHDDALRSLAEVLRPGVRIRFVAPRGLTLQAMLRSGGAQDRLRWLVLKSALAPDLPRYVHFGAYHAAWRATRRWRRDLPASATEGAMAPLAATDAAPAVAQR